ncbi:hypothetical protein TorRG33x02_298880, partial [Trema orientale]
HVALRTSENYIMSGSFSWSLGFSRNLNERETKQVSGLITVLDLVRCRVEENDMRIWQLDRSGQFSCKSLFFKLRANDDDVPFPYYFIWRSTCPMKVKVFC